MIKSHSLPLVWAALALIACGCVSGHSNSQAARPNTGYVDLYSPENPDLCWEVRETTGSGTDSKTLFSDLKPVEGGVLRLSLAPGHHQLHVSVLNRVITRPAEVEVDVENGNILPLRVTLAEAGATTVMTGQKIRGNTFYGPAGRRTEIITDEASMYDVSISAGAIVHFLPKHQMPYATRPPNNSNL